MQWQYAVQVAQTLRLKVMGNRLSSNMDLSSSVNLLFAA